MVNFNINQCDIDVAVMRHANLYDFVISIHSIYPGYTSYLSAVYNEDGESLLKEQNHRERIHFRHSCDDVVVLILATAALKYLICCCEYS